MKTRNTNIHKLKAFSLIELAIVVFLMFSMLGILSFAQGRIVAAQGARTMTEMGSILDAARQFYSQNNRWPNDMTELRTFLPNIAANNVFGNTYNVSPNGGIFTVNSEVPYKSVNVIKNGRFVVVTDTGSDNIIQLSTTFPINSKTGRLQYEKTH